MQMKPTKKRPEPQKLLSGRILDDTSDLPTRSVGGHCGMNPFPSSKRTRGRLLPQRMIGGAVLTQRCQIGIFAIFPPICAPAARDRRRSRCLHTSMTRRFRTLGPSQGRPRLPRAAHGAALRHRLCHLEELASDLRVRYGVIEPDELDRLWSLQLLAGFRVLDAQLGTVRLQIGEEV